MIKSHADLRKERGIEIPHNRDSEYIRYDETIEKERDERVFAPLQVPKNIEANLPFKSREKVMKVVSKDQVEVRRKTNLLDAL